MDLATVFYIIGIIYMLVMLFITFFILYQAIQIMKKIEHVQNEVTYKLKNILAPASFVALGSSLFGKLTSKLKGKFFS